MRVTLPVRLFLIQFLFTVGAGTAAVLLVRRSFEGYNERWRHEVTATFAAELYGPMAAEVARSLLIGQESEFPEVREERRNRIAEGLATVLRGLPNIRSVLILDRDLRIQYASDPAVQDLTFTRPRDREFLSSAAMSMRVREDGAGGAIEEVLVPVFDDRPRKEPQAGPLRLGSVLVRLVPDASLVSRATERNLPDIPPWDYALPVILFLAASAAGGIAMAALTGLPVQRLDRALAELRARGFRGRIDPAQLGLQGHLVSAVQAINEMGGRLESLDARGKEREALLEKLSQSLEEGMLALGPRGAPVAWNRALLRMLGSPASAEGEDPPEARAVTEEQAVRELLTRSPQLLDAAAEGGSGVREMDLLRADGTAMPARVTGVPFEARPGEPGTLLLVRDLATLRTIESHLMEAGRFAVLAHLAAGLAHEIRNPLHSIGLNATVVEQCISSDPGPERTLAMRESLETIQGETRRLAELLNSYLGFVRTENTAGSVHLREICVRVMQLLAFTARKSHVEILLEGQEEIPPVRGVADRLQQAVLNLVLNAIQAMPGGGTVSLRTSASNSIVRLTVADTGPGVPDSVAARIFESRVTTKPGGTGLGLPLVRMIAEAHGGSVWHKSKPGQGAAFTLVLPASKGT